MIHPAFKLIYVQILIICAHCLQSSANIYIIIFFRGSPHDLYFRKVEGQTQPVISGVHVDLVTGKISPVQYNRTFTDFEGSIRDALLINISSLFKKKSNLRKMIAQQEDRGFAKSSSIKGYDNDVRRY